MTIIKKELARFFGDKRMVFTTILMPGLMIYIMYSFMGSGLTSRFEADEDYTYRIYAENMPSTVSAMIKGSDINVEYLDLFPFFLQLRKFSIMTFSASASVMPSVLSFNSCSSLIRPIAASWMIAASTCFAWISGIDPTWA